MTSRLPRSRFYDGRAYGRLVDPLLAGIRGFVARELPPGERVLDACCGTGALARRLAEDGRTVLGVDLSPRNIDYARSHSKGGARFELADVTTLEIPREGRWDVATIVLALHEMPAPARAPVLRRVLVVDYAVPMPRNPAGLRNRLLEVAAGPEHFGAFRDFKRRGGLPALIEGSGATVERARELDAGTLSVRVLARDQPRT